MKDQFQVRTFLESFGCFDIEPEDYEEAFPLQDKQKTEISESDASMLDPENLIL